MAGSLLGRDGMNGDDQTGVRELMPSVISARQVTSTLRSLISRQWIRVAESDQPSQPLLAELAWASRRIVAYPFTGR